MEDVEALAPIYGLKTGCY